MAKIEMDISEYDAMRKNSQLLEESLQKENALQEQIKELNLEKIKALEDSARKIVKITKSERIESVFLRENPKIIFQRLQNVWDFSRERFMSSSMNSFIESELERLADTFFYKAIQVVPETTEIKYEGLSEVIEELRKEVGQEFEKELAQLSVLRKENDSLVNANYQLKKEANIFREREDYKMSFLEENKLLNEFTSKVKDAVKNAKYNSWNLINCGDSIRNVLQIIIDEITNEAKK